MFKSLACHGQLPPKLQAGNVVASPASFPICLSPGPGKKTEETKTPHGALPASLSFSLPGPSLVAYRVEP